MTLYISAYYPDSELQHTEFGESLTRIALKWAKAVDRPPQNGSPNLDFYFLVPSESDKPDFHGMRIHSYHDETKTLRVEGAVPKQMITSKHAEAYIVASLQDAIDNAADFFSEMAMIFRRDDYLNRVDQILG